LAVNLPQAADRPKPAEADIDGQALLRRIAAGEEAAMAEFYRAYENSLYRFILSRLNDPFEAADILNEVMLEVWRGAGRFQGRSTVKSWIFGIARHKALDRLRSRQRNAARAGEEPSEDIPDADAVDPAEAIAATQNAGFVKHCLERMSAAHREVLHLTFFEDLTYGQIAEIAGCPEGTVKTRMFHAKRAMQHCLAKLMGRRE
jgi:RNA polymerase sigma-70 factor (ECF subfamily)